MTFGFTGMIGSQSQELVTVRKLRPFFHKLLRLGSHPFLESLFLGCLVRPYTSGRPRSLAWCVTISGTGKVAFMECRLSQFTASCKSRSPFPVEQNRAVFASFCCVPLCRKSMTAQPMRYWADFKRGGSDYSSHFTATAKHKRSTMSRTYKAVEATQPGKLEVVERAMIEPAFGQVRIHVEACGVCHSDALTVEGGFPGLTFPRVPGHEVIGKVEALGPGVQGWKEGQRAGGGYMGGHCGHCERCGRGDLVNCQNQPISGVHSD